jgi:hypothetical protein
MRQERGRDRLLPEAILNSPQIYHDSAALIRNQLQYNLQYQLIPRLTTDNRITLSNLHDLLLQTATGMALNQRASCYTVYELKDLLTYTRLTLAPNKSNMEIAQSYQYSQAYVLLKKTLSWLHDQRMVTFADFEKPVDDLCLGTLELAPTYWKKNYTSEVIWSELDDMLVIATQLLHSTAIPPAALLRSGHYYAAAAETSKIHN